MYSTVIISELIIDLFFFVSRNGIIDAYNLITNACDN